MCIENEYEKFGFCFDEFVTDLGCGWDRTIQAYLLDHDVVVVDEGEFGLLFQQFLEKCVNEGMLIPAMVDEE